MALLYRDKTARLKRMFFDVQNEVGLGRHEEAYHRACVLWLRAHGIPFASKPPHRLMLGNLGNNEAHVLYPDLVLWDCITVELKAPPRMLGRNEAVQLFDYLKCRGDRLGLLVNMGLDRVTDECFVHDPPTTRLVEDWSRWSEAIDASVQELGIAVRDALPSIYREHSTGYGASVVDQLVRCALGRLGLRITVRPTSTARFRGIEIHESALDCLIVDRCLIVVSRALFDDIQFSINRGLSFMRALRIEWGVAVDFGKADVHVSGLRQRAVTSQANRLQMHARVVAAEHRFMPVSQAMVCMCGFSRRSRAEWWIPPRRAAFLAAPAELATHAGKRR